MPGLLGPPPAPDRPALAQPPQPWREASVKTSIQLAGWPNGAPRVKFSTLDQKTRLGITDCGKTFVDKLKIFSPVTMNERTMIPVLPDDVPLLTRCGNILTDVVQKKFGVCAILHNIKSSSSVGGARTAQLNSGMRCAVRLPGGLEISVWKGDLTTHRVDAVVNAANEWLQHYGGLARALCDAGGPQIQQMSDQITAKSGSVPTGEAVLTDSGNLPCKAIIHAVGPRLSDNPGSEEVKKASVLLRMAVERSLKSAEDHNFQSLAIPALSSGIFNFPLDSCAEIIVETVKNYRYSARALLSEVHLVNHDERTVSAMERAFKKLLEPTSPYSAMEPKSPYSAMEPKSSYSAMEPKSPFSAMEPKSPYSAMEPKSPYSAMESKSPYSAMESRPSYSSAVKHDTTGPAALLSLQMGSITMYIKKAHIEQEKVDVIVNTIAPDLNLSAGAVSNAILKKAVVYHTVCATKRDRGSQILRLVTDKCLQKAYKGMHSSIAFPAIGTGNLGLDKKEVAKLMIAAVADFARQHKEQRMDVYFVLYPGDKQTIKAFQQEMSSVKGDQPVRSREFSPASSPEGYQGSKGSSELNLDTPGEQPCIELLSSTKENRREASRWIYDTIFKAHETCTILNNHILHLGQNEHEELQIIQSDNQVSIREFLQDGLAGVTITGSRDGVQEAALRVEALCCTAQEEFARSEESALMRSVVRWRCNEFQGFEEPEVTGTLERARLEKKSTLSITVNGCEHQVSLEKMETRSSNRKSYLERTSLYKDNPLDRKFHNGSFYQRTEIERQALGSRDQAAFKGFDVVKIEKVENPLLEHHFKQKQKQKQKQMQLSDSRKTLFQQVPAQFCDLVCRVGFQRLYSPPNGQKYGAGMYFGRSVSAAMKQAEHLRDEEYIYIFQAQVLTGRDTKGSPDLIIPPALGSDPLCRYDSVWGSADTHVIFNSHQALPEYLFTCRKRSTGSPV
ncbi:hypothetical protein GJAV_G00205660 [Gymnothorax javanicus]|nr:hypothetical protein GJAV_G00205660 [Gymnothorax javanicus]